MMNDAKWIWLSEGDNKRYAQTIEFRRDLEVSSVSNALMRITADSSYRLVVNGEVVADGPCRSWPFAYQYDEVDVSRYLRMGTNSINVIVRYFGCGTSAQIPQEGALLAELVLAPASGAPVTICTDSNWLARRLAAYRSNVPKINLGLGPMEIIDAEVPPGSWSPAAEIHDVKNAPWSLSGPRDVALLTRNPIRPGTVRWVRAVSSDWNCAAFSPVRLLYPGLMELGGFTCMASVAATCVHNDTNEKRTIEIRSYPSGEGPDILLNGQPGDCGRYELLPGENLLLAFMEPWGHHNKEQAIRFQGVQESQFRNPSNGSSENRWDYCVLPELLYHEEDATDLGFNPPQRTQHQKRVEQKYAELKAGVRSLDDYRSALSQYAREDLFGDFPVENPHLQFEFREVLAEQPERLALLSGGGRSDLRFPLDVATVRSGDVEICFDLGTETVGYLEFDVEAPAGTIIDAFLVEYIDNRDRVQHTWACRNGIRYTCVEGVNEFRSLIRRAGRYLFVTVRNCSGDVKINDLRMIESTYPAVEVGSFECSDPMANQLWKTSVRTLLLCMEDVFTDCPLYEQTLWVGDARNEALFAEPVYGQLDIAKRCLLLAAQGLERYPIVPSHVPSSNKECLLPAWAFLWGRMVWDYYWYSGDVETLRTMWPYVLRNLAGAERLRDDRGLFSAAAWNMFDWTGIDAGHRTVTHNSMLLVGCIDAGVLCAEALGEMEEAQRLRQWRGNLVDSINMLWSSELNSYVDSVHDDGKLSQETCVHTNFLALLHGIVPAEHRAHAIENVLNPPESMTRIGSPFAIQYLYEALDHLGLENEILDLMESNYYPMLETGAVTLWEQFPNGTGFNPEGFPTRSHCHAWSSSPIYFYNRIVLGIRQMAVGAMRYGISPNVSRHHYAEGKSASIRGAISVKWQRDGDDLSIEARGPDDVELLYLPNASHAGLSVSFNGTLVRAIEEPSANIPTG